MRVIHWLRRDLRLTDNTALHAAANTGGQIIAVHVQSDWQGTHHWTGPMRQEFLCGCLRSLARNLDHLGSRLIIRRGRAEDALEQLVRETKCGAIYFNRDPDPWGRATEEK